MIGKYRNEEWRNVQGFEGLYQVSSFGRVKSMARTTLRPEGRKGNHGKMAVIPIRERILKPGVMPTGHRHVGLRKDGKTHARLIHRLVLESFVGPCPKGEEGCHEDGNPSNNHYSNLRWDTHDSNQKDMIRHGTTTSGEKQPGSKLTVDKVREIRLLFSTGKYTKQFLGKRFGVSEATIRYAVRRVCWGHVE